MKRLTLTLSAMALVVGAAGCGSTHSTTPPPQKPGWTVAEVQELVASTEKLGRTPTQAKCEVAFVASKVTPSQAALITSKRLGDEAKAACGVQ